MFLRKITVSVRMGTGQTEEFKYDKDLGVAKPEPLQELAKKGGVVDNLINWATALTTIFSKFKSFKELRQASKQKKKKKRNNHQTKNHQNKTNQLCPKSKKI